MGTLKGESRSAPVRVQPISSSVSRAKLRRRVCTDIAPRCCFEEACWPSLVPRRSPVQSRLISYSRVSRQSLLRGRVNDLSHLYKCVVDQECSARSPWLKQKHSTMTSTTHLKRLERLQHELRCLLE